MKFFKLTLAMLMCCFSLGNVMAMPDEATGPRQRVFVVGLTHEQAAQLVQAVKQDHIAYGNMLAKLCVAYGGFCGLASGLFASIALDPDCENACTVLTTAPSFLFGAGALYSLYHAHDIWQKIAAMKAR